MKLSPYINLKRIEFVVTYHCTGRCIHCSVGEGNNVPEHPHVQTEAAVSAIRQLTGHFPIASVMTFGGEPLLYPDTVCAIHKTARDCGIEIRQLITNGYFSKDNDRIREVAENLKEAGVNNLLLSVDAFHQQTIPLEPVQSFAGWASKAGIEKLHLSPAWLVNKEHDNTYNAKTKELLAAFSDLGISESHGNNIFMAGNAAKYLAEYYPAPNLCLSDSCGSQPYTDPLTDITSLSIVPNGDVMICNFAIGNIYREDLLEIVARYDPHANKYMRAILERGAAGLLDIAGQNNIPADISKCYTICDLCKQVTASNT